MIDSMGNAPSIPLYGLAVLGWLRFWTTFDMRGCDFVLRNVATLVRYDVTLDAIFFLFVSSISLCSLRILLLIYFCYSQCTAFNSTR
jgi:hypothetical protein